MNEKMIEQLERVREKNNELLYMCNRIRTIQNFQNFQWEYKSYIKEENFEGFKSNILKFLNDELLDKATTNINYCYENLKKDFSKENIEYNENYYNFISNYIIDIESRITHYIDAINHIIHSHGNHKDMNVYDGLKNIHNMFIDSEYDVSIFKYFSQKDRKSYVIFGKNGSGKTKLIERVSKSVFSNNSIAIKASRNTEFNEYANINQSIISSFNLNNADEIENNNYVRINDVLALKLMSNEYKEFKNNNFEKVNENSNCGKTIYKINNIFNSISIDRKFKIDDIEGKQVMLFSDTVEPYPASNASDGEKNVFYIVSFIMLCPQNAFVFIDEPELHLNRALAIELFDRLEKERDDLVFIYCTHDVDFIESRTDAKLICLEKYNGKNWDVKPIDEFDNIPKEVLVSILGTKKNILFIEGDKTSLDFKIYSILFNNFKIIPVETCEKVKTFCYTFNSRKENRKYLGIIDSDYESNKDKNGLYSLKVNEIENILIDEDVLEKIKVFNTNNETKDIDIVNQMKCKVIKTITDSKNDIIMDYANKKHRTVLLWKKVTEYNGDKQFLKEKVRENIDNNIDSYVDLITKFEKRLNELITNNDYNNLVKEISHKGCINEIRKVLGISEEKYIECFCRLLKDDNKLRNKIISKYFSDISFNVDV